MYILLTERIKLKNVVEDPWTNHMLPLQNLAGARSIIQNFVIAFSKPNTTAFNTTKNVQILKSHQPAQTKSLQLDY